MKALFFLHDYIEKSSCKVLSFASKAFEINLWPLNRLLIEEKRLLLPRLHGNKIEVYEVDDMRNLTMSSLGIQEPNPQSCRKVEIAELNGPILIPGLGFDEKFQRLGYGKGHYDKFLSLLPNHLKWGIGFKEQNFSLIPTEAHDVKLNEVFLF